MRGLHCHNEFTGVSPMFGLLNEVVKLAVNTAEITVAPLTIGLKLINEPIEEIAKTVKEIEQDL